MRPVIGLTCTKENIVNGSINRINTTYINVVLRAGGLPIIIPVVEDIRDSNEYIDLLDGIIFTGGGDIAAQYFDEEPLREVDELCPDRDRIEMELFHEAYKRGKPILGICRGAQLINIALGGSIYQDIYSQLPNVLGHSLMTNIQEGYHTIDIERDSVMFEIFGEEKLLVNSQHHQSIKALGKNLVITARSLDGIVEAIESTNEKYILGLQFHPEAMAMKYPVFLKPFINFINRCK